MSRGGNATLLTRQLYRRTLHPRSSHKHLVIVKGVDIVRRSQLRGRMRDLLNLLEFTHYLRRTCPASSPPLFNQLRNKNITSRQTTLAPWKVESMNNIVCALAGL